MAFLLHPLGLGQRGGSLFALDGLHHESLFLRFQIGQLHGGRDGDFLVIHHLLKLRGQLGEADVPLNLSAAFSGFTAHKLRTL